MSTTYSLAGYAGMIADGVRTRAYFEALRRAVRPGATVLDIGAGIGTFALLAAQLGARHVWAVEPADAILVGAELAAANGLSDSITILQKVSTEIDLPERVDVIVSDLRGISSLYSHHIPAIVDARTRLLKPGGTLIPCRDDLWLGIVDSPEESRTVEAPWGEQDLGLDLAPVRQMLSNTTYKGTGRSPAFLAPPARWFTLAYDTVESPHASGRVSGTVAAAGLARGFRLWFETELVPGVGYSTSPELEKTVYGDLFFPFSEPVAVEVGDTVVLDLEARLVHDDYVWRWNTVFERSGRTPARIEFHQSTFFSVPLSPERLAKRRSDFKPGRTDAAEQLHFVLGLMDGERTLSEIVARVQERFPGRFKSVVEALDEVSRISEEHGKGRAS